MTLSQILGGGGGLLFLLLSFIQVSKINVNPWSWLARHVGRALNAETNEKLDTVIKDQSEMKVQLFKETEARLQDKAETARVRIIRFASEIERNDEHPQEQYQNALSDVDYYEHYCKEHPDFPNNQCVISIQLIKDTYAKLLREHRFTRGATA